MDSDILSPRTISSDSNGTSSAPNSVKLEEPHLTQFILHEIALATESKAVFVVLCNVGWIDGTLLMGLSRASDGSFIRERTIEQNRTLRVEIAELLNCQFHQGRFVNLFLNHVSDYASFRIDVETLHLRKDVVSVQAYLVLFGSTHSAPPHFYSLLQEALTAHPTAHAIVLSNAMSHFERSLTALTEYIDKRFRFSGPNDLPFLNILRTINKHFLNQLMKFTCAFGGRMHIPARDSVDFIVLLTNPSSRVPEHMHSPALITHTAHGRHARVINDPTEFFSRHPEFEYDVPILRKGRKPTSILTVPLVAYPDELAPVVAVAELHSNAPFGLSDVASAEHIAAAYRRYASHFMLRVFEGHIDTPADNRPRTSLAEKPFTSLFDHRDTVEISNIDPRFRRIPPTQDLCDRIPLAVKESGAMIQLLLQLFAAVTPCCFAQFRAVSYDRKSLIRLETMISREISFDPQPEISLTAHSESLNAYVARHGIMAFVHDYKSATFLDAFPGLQTAIPTFNSSASLTIPVFMGYRVIGTFHFESHTRNAFAGIGAFARLLGAHLGAYVHRAFLTTVSATFPVRCEKVAVQHECRHILDKVKRAILASMPGSHNEVSSPIIKVIDRGIARLSNRISDRATGLSASLKSLITAMLDELFAPEGGIEWEPHVFESMSVRADFVAHLWHIVLPILDNALGVTRGTESRVSLELDPEYKFGGADYCQVIISNTFLPSQAPMHLPERLYQALMPGDSGGVSMGIGALSAAALADSIGGHIYVRDFVNSVKSQELVTCIAIPLDLFLRANST